MAASDERPKRRRGRRYAGSRSEVGVPQQELDLDSGAGPFDVDIDIPSLRGVDSTPLMPLGAQSAPPAFATDADPGDTRPPVPAKRNVGLPPDLVNPRAPEGFTAPVVSEIFGPVEIPQIVVGVRSPDVEPVVTSSRFRDVPFRADTIIDGWSNDVVTVRGASLRGHVHRYNGAPRQDDFAVHALPDGRLIALVADGVSSAKQSHLGSTMAVRQATQWLKTRLPARTCDADWMALVREAAFALVSQAQAMLQLQDPPDVGTAEKELATTLLCAVIEPTEPGTLRASIIGIGDSGAWLLRDGTFTPVLGGKAPDEGGLSSNAVAGLPRLPADLQPSVIDIRAGDVLLLGTDGFGDPLGTGEGGVGNLFRQLFNGSRTPSLIEFAHALDFSRETFDDDRTLVAIAVSPHQQMRPAAAAVAGEKV